MRSRRAWKEILVGVDGAEIAEAAFVLPLLFMILIGIFWFGRAYNIYSTITHAAHEGARVAATPLCATCAAVSCGGTSSAFPCDTAVVDAVSSTLRASKLDPARIVAVTPAPTPTFCSNPPVAGCAPTNNVYVCRGVLLTSATNTVQECGSMVTFKYPYQFYFPFTSLNLQFITLPATSEVRMEY